MVRKDDDCRQSVMEFLEYTLGIHDITTADIEAAHPLPSKKDSSWVQPNPTTEPTVIVKFSHRQQEILLFEIVNCWRVKNSRFVKIWRR